MKRSAIVCIIICCLASGCSKSYKMAIFGTADTAQVCSFAEMIEYLRSQDLAKLESVEHWYGKGGPGLKITTAHYEVFTTLLEPLMLRRVPQFMEAAYKAYNGQLSKPVQAATRSVIYLFADRQQWEDFTREFAGEQAGLFCRIKAGAYYHNGACVTYNIGPNRTFSALGHEGWHQFNSRHFEFRLPSWLDEGVAMLFEAYGNEEGEFRFEPSENDYRLDALAKTLKNGEMIPLKELIGMSPGEVLATDAAEAVMAFYSQSYALLRFMREGVYGTMLDDYLRLLQDGLDGDWPIDRVSGEIARDRNKLRTILWNRIVGRVLFENYIGGDFERIEGEYLTFCRQIVRQ